MTEPHLRIGDAERDAAAADLGEHFALGRLTGEEHAERLDRIWAARTHADLGPVFADLPSPYAARPPAPSGLSAPSARRPTWSRPSNPTSGRRRGWRGLPVPVLALVAVLTVLLALAHLPVILIGLGVCWFVSSRHRGGHRTGCRAGRRRSSPHGWHH